MWVFQQKDGDISQHDAFGNSSHLCFGYSGRGIGKNNPEMEMLGTSAAEATGDMVDFGPLPRGIYDFGEPIDHPHLGKFAIPLLPRTGNAMYGRAGFYWHGDNAEHEASLGCIVSLPQARRRAWGSGDHQLQVVSGTD